ncbi:uncharacterized protein LOC107041131 [Diachasma alloeum]|uniref:uncharacterized protein LOC107041131 n=1 Tax=Diachasma alloeum TaxID=454923 RepID=UPI0007383EF7|nr:uncharacterized protein LOC107041131 [Diachasma alloeum]
MSDADNSPAPHCSNTEPIDDGLEVQDPPVADPNVFTNLDLLTSSAYLQSISSATTKLVEIIGIIHLVKEAETVTCKNGAVNDVCTFFVHNNDGEIVQCVMWGEIMDKFLDQLLVYHVIHIDGAYPKYVKDQFNSGTTPYELVLQSNTTVTDLGKIQLQQRSQSTTPEITPLIDLATCKKIAALSGFVKTPWTVIEKQVDSTGNTCYGSIAAQKYFVDVKISDFPSDFSSPFVKGQHVQCVGSVIRNGSRFFFCVQAPFCITLVDQTVATFKDLLRCQPLMIRNQADSNNRGDATAVQPKKLKRSEISNKRCPKKD